MLWDLNEGKHLYTLDGGDIINALCFSPNRYWLCAATGPSIKIWVCRRSVPQPLSVPIWAGFLQKTHFLQPLGCAGFGVTFMGEILTLDHRSRRRSSPGGASPPVWVTRQQPVPVASSPGRGGLRWP